jgi:hypothetical protein
MLTIAFAIESMPPRRFIKRKAHGVNSVGFVTRGEEIEKVSDRWNFLSPWHPTSRFSLATLLIFVTIVCVAIAQPHLTWAIVAASLYVLVGCAAIAGGWRATHHRLAIRSLAGVFGVAMLAAGVWVFVMMLSR